MRKQTKTITIRLTPEEFNEIKRKIEKSGISQSNYIRQSLLNSRIISTEEIKKFIPELIKIGNNLNQIAKKCNCGYQPTFEEIQKQSLMLKEFFQKVVDFLKGKSLEVKTQISKEEMAKNIIKFIETYYSERG